MITLRLIVKTDAPIFMSLRNGDNTYRWFYSNRRFTLQEVEEWIEKLDPNKDVVFMVEQDRQVIGTCSIYNINNGRAEVGRIIVSEGIRGKGIGTNILQQITQVATTRGLQLLYANIKTENVRSYRAFEKAGYKRISENPDTGYYYELELI